jgi:ABC-type oligopeptide transport system substrate-binding subunit
MGRRLGLSLLALGTGVALLVSAAFAGPHGDTRRGGTLRVMFGAEPDSVDPALATGSIGSWTLLYATCAKLFNTLPDPDTGRRRIAPEVVRSFPDVSNDGRTYTFELRRTFRFHNRMPVTAQSFADAFNRNANPKLNSLVRRRGWLQEIVGANAAMRGRARTISGVQVLGRYRLRVRLRRRAGDFVARLTMPSFCPILPGTSSDPAEMDRPPGSGPYYIADRVPNRRIVLERNPYYGGSRTANPDRIVWTIEPNPAARLRATERDENDFMGVFAVQDDVVRNLKDRYGLNRPGGQFLRLPSLTNYFFVFNADRPAFKGLGQAPLGKAINYALDRKALIQAHGYLETRRSDRLLPAPLSASRRVYPLDGPDLVTARRWLARAKLRPRKLTLYTANFAFSIASAQVFSSNLRPLGIEVDVKPFDPITLLEKLRRRTQGEPFDVALLNWGAFYADPAGAVLPLLRGTRYEARANAANRATGSARAKSWADLETDLMRNDPPVAAYADITARILVSRSFGCFGSLQGYDLDLAAACKK